MKVLFIGGTGIISSASVRLALARGMDVTLLNRGNSFRPTPAAAKVIEADIGDLEGARRALGISRLDTSKLYGSHNDY